MQSHYILIVFNRPNHTQKVLDALKAEGIKTFTVFVDGAESEIDKEKQKKIYQLLRQVDWAQVTIRRRRKNLRLAKSVTLAVTETLREYDSVFVLEDDCVPKEGLLNYVRESLRFYKKSPQVRSVCAYSYPTKSRPKSSAYFLERFCPWGWGTWKDRWKDYNPNLRVLVSKITQDTYKKIPKDIVKCIENERFLNHPQDIWSLNWILMHYLTDTLVVYPPQSLIENIGFDGSGIHSARTNVFRIDAKHRNKKKIFLPRSIKTRRNLRKEVDGFLLNNYRKTMRF